MFTPVKPLRSALVVAFGLLLNACSPMGKPATTRFVNQSLNFAACTDYSQTVFDAMIASLQNGEPLPSLQEFKEESSMQIQAVLPSQETSRFSNSMTQTYGVLLEAIDDALASGNRNEALRILSAMESNDPNFASVKTELQNHVSELSVSALGLNLNCKEVNRPVATNAPLFESIKALAHPAVYGGHKVTATSYQSCMTLDQAPMDANTSSVKGIVVTGTHENGVGQRRIIASVPEVANSHYYIAGINPAQNTCFNLKKNPLIYDYGGKPYATSGVQGTLNTFKDAGTGTEVLGIDCSGYVFSAFATAGLKMSPTEVLKAQNVYGINSARFKNAPDSGLTCFEYAKVSAQKSLLPGDVVASDGHVFLVDWVGEDPLGISKISKAEDCKLGPISTSKFDFVLSQSAPVKGAIGINRMQASAYLTSGDMKRGLEQYAIRACIAKFTGQIETLTLNEIGIVRHKRTPDCISEEVALEGQSCLNTCRL